MTRRRNKTDVDRLQDVATAYYGTQVQALPSRAIKYETAAYFDARLELSQADGVTPVKQYFPLHKDDKLVAYKVKNLDGSEPRFYHIGLSKDVELFGEYQAAHSGAKKLIITEGELDALSVYQCLREQAQGTPYANFQPAVVSINHGAKNNERGARTAAEAIGERMAFLSRFEEFILCFDMDKAGKVTAAALAQYLPPGKTKIATLPLKDANEMLMAGKEVELKKAVIFNAQPYRPAQLVTISDVYEEARKPVEWGLSWPWQTLTRLTYGIRQGELIGVGAGTGCGKSTFWHQLIEHLAFTHNLRVGLFMLEERPAKTVRALVSKRLRVDLGKPGVEYDQDAVDELIKQLDPYIRMFKHGEDRTWETIKEHLRHMVLVMGCKHIILDPVTNMTAHLSSSEANDKLNSIFNEAEAMAAALDFTLYYSCHLNAPAKEGKPHEEGGRVKLAQFTGSKAMGRTSHYILGLERDTQAEDIRERNTVICRVLKDREHGQTGKFTIEYNADLGTFLEPTAERPAHVVY